MAARGLLGVSTPADGVQPGVGNLPGALGAVGLSLASVFFFAGTVLVAVFGDEDEVDEFNGERAA